MKQVIITGATSMIGVELVKTCIKHHVQVIALTRPGSRNINRLPESQLLTVVPYVSGAMLDVLPQVGKADAFFHLAWAYTTEKERCDPLLQQLNVNYSMEAVEFAHKAGCEQFVFVGSQAEYGRIEGKMHPDSPADPIISYGVCKLAAGRLCAIYCEQHGIAFKWGRILSIYGYYDHEWSLIHSTIEKVLTHGELAFTPCEQIWDFLFCEDAGNALYLIGEHGRDQSIYCIGSGQGRRLSDFLKELGQCMNVDLSPYIGRIPYRTDQVMNLCADIDTLAADTGFKPTTSFSEGVNKTVRWQQAQYTTRSFINEKN